MIVEQLNNGILIKEKLDECIKKKVLVCEEKMIIDQQKKMRELQVWGDQGSEEKGALREQQILRSLTDGVVKEEEKEDLNLLQMKKEDDFIPLQRVVEYSCERNHSNPGSSCKLNKKDIPVILTKDVNNLTEDDVMTMLATYRDTKSLVEDQDAAEIISRVHEHFATKSLSDVPEDILKNEQLEYLKNSCMRNWVGNLALRTVVLDEVNKQAVVAIEQTGKEKEIHNIVKELSENLNQLPKATMMVSFVGELTVAESKVRLAKWLADKIIVEKKPCEGKPNDFWLMWTVKNCENLPWQELGKAPDVTELKRASITFRRFHNAKAILKTDDYHVQIEKILGGTL